MLTRRQAEKQLFLQYHRTGSRRDRDALIERFMPLARSLARRYRRGPEPLEDLEQVASLALLRAVEGFDHTRELAFSSYAVPSIAGALKRHYRDCGWSVRMPRDLQELALRIERFNEDAWAANGAAPTATRIAERAGVSVEAVIEAREAHLALRADSLDQPLRASEDDAGVSLLDTLSTRDLDFQRAFDRMVLDSLLETLDERDRTIVRLYYREELTQSEIGDRLGLSQMHISRLLRQATAQLAAAAQEPAAA
ncbi:MAG: sigma-70 family RNA polymerase sigma factor [Solirubrobacteraceae bacterium]